MLKLIFLISHVTSQPLNNFFTKMLMEDILLIGQKVIQVKKLLYKVGTN